MRAWRPKKLHISLCSSLSRISLQKNHYSTAEMSTPIITLSTLKFVKPAALANALSQQSASEKVAIIDVRDNDHIGGHIKNSQWVPIDQLDVRLPELLRVNAGKEMVVFHCMLSQQRGPKAALLYARAKAREVEKQTRQRKEESEKKSIDEAGGELVVENDGDSEQSEGVVGKDGTGRIGGQEICVLEGGFSNWQSFYAEDEKLTAGYVRDLWA